jgi:S-ribosylhomocysteine lyase
MRNSSVKDDVVYFGPMGCRTGFYLVMFGDLAPQDICPSVLEMCDFILSFEGDIPGAAPEQCGNWSEQNLDMAKYYIRKYRTALAEDRNFSYPEQEEQNEI